MFTGATTFKTSTTSSAAGQIIDSTTTTTSSSFEGSSASAGSRVIADSSSSSERSVKNSHHLRRLDLEDWDDAYENANNVAGVIHMPAPRPTESTRASHVAPDEGEPRSSSLGDTNRFASLRKLLALLVPEAANDDRVIRPARIV